MNQIGLFHVSDFKKYFGKDDYINFIGHIDEITYVHNAFSVIIISKLLTFEEYSPL